MLGDIQSSRVSRNAKKEVEELMSQGCGLACSQVVKVDSNSRRMGEGGDGPVATSAVLMSISRHISAKCVDENRSFLNCKRNDADPESCLPQGQKVTRCVVSLLRELNETCPKAMDAFTKCMDYYGNEFELCRKQQQEFEKSCPL